jgi:hypothetical protein
MPAIDGKLSQSFLVPQVSKASPIGKRLFTAVDFVIRNVRPLEGLSANNSFYK